MVSIYPLLNSQSGDKKINTVVLAFEMISSFISAKAKFCEKHVEILDTKTIAANKNILVEWRIVSILILINKTFSTKVIAKVVVFFNN